MIWSALQKKMNSSLRIAFLLTLAAFSAALDPEVNMNAVRESKNARARVLDDVVLAEAVHG